MMVTLANGKCCRHKDPSAKNKKFREWLLELYLYGKPIEPLIPCNFRFVAQPHYIQLLVRWDGQTSQRKNTTTYSGSHNKCKAWKTYMAISTYISSVAPTFIQHSLYKYAAKGTHTHTHCAQNAQAHGLAVDSVIWGIEEWWFRLPMGTSPRQSPSATPGIHVRPQLVQNVHLM